MGWISQPVMDDDGEYLGIVTMESGPRGQNPGELYQDYRNMQFKIVRTMLNDEQARKVVIIAAQYGYRKYDWLLPIALIKRFGMFTPKIAGKDSAAIMVLKRVLGLRICTPHVRDGRDVCVEYVQEPYEASNLPLCDIDKLLVPDITGSIYWNCIFESFPGWTLDDLPILRPGDLFISRSEGLVGNTIRWWFSGNE